MMFYSGLYERIEVLNGVSCSCSENGFAEEYGYLVILSVTMLCDVLYYDDVSWCCYTPLLTPELTHSL